MYPYWPWLKEHSQQVTVHWSWRGGAGIEWAEEQVGRTGSYNLVVLKMSGNDWENWCSPCQLADRIEHLANRMITTGTQAVAITSLWPRSNARYNLDAQLYAGLMERRLQGYPVVSFWLWNSRQAWRNYDDCGASNKEKGGHNSLFWPFADRLIM
mgnify:CR=1 FL=1